MAKKTSIEETLNQISEILTKMEAGDLSLEESFRCYEQGMKLVQSCEKQIGMIEKKVQAITESGETYEFE